MPLRSAFIVGLVVIAMLTGFRLRLAPRKLMADKTASTLIYIMKHPMHTWDGVSHDVNGIVLYDDATKQITQVAIAAKVASFDSQNANRDSHAMEVLEGIKYPNVTFASQQIKPVGTDGLLVTGNLTFHGQTRPVTIQATRRDANGQMLVSGTFKVKLDEYNIERPSLMMVPVEDPFEVKFSLTFRTAVQ